MKKILFLLIGWCTFNVGFTSCDKEENEDFNLPQIREGYWEIKSGETFTGRFEIYEYHVLAEVITEQGEITFLVIGFYVIEENNEPITYFTYGLNEEEYFEGDGHSPASGTIIQQGRSCNYALEIHTSFIKFTIQTPDTEGILRTWELHLYFVDQ